MDVKNGNAVRVFLVNLLGQAVVLLSKTLRVNSAYVNLLRKQSIAPY